MNKIEGELLQVKAGCVLHWPPPISTRRGGPGFVVKSGDPFIAECRHLLEPAPAGAYLSPHSNPAAAKEYARQGYLDEAFDPSANAEQRAADKAAGLKNADEAPKGKAASPKTKTKAPDRAPADG